HLDPAMLGEGTVVAARTAVAGARLAQVGEADAAEVARLIDVDDVLVGAVATTDRIADPAEGSVGEDANLEVDGAGESNRSARDLLDRRLVGEIDGIAAERALHLGRRRLVVTAHEDRNDVACARPEEQRLDEALHRQAQERGDVLDALLPRRRDALLGRA